MERVTESDRREVIVPGTPDFRTGGMGAEDRNEVYSRRSGSADTGREQGDIIPPGTGTSRGGPPGTGRVQLLSRASSRPTLSRCGTEDIYSNVIQARGALHREGSVQSFVASNGNNRRGAIFTNVFEDDAENGVFYDIDQQPDEKTEEKDKDIMDFGIREACKARYTKACKQLGIAPSTRILSILKTGSDVVNLRGNQLGQKGLNAACAALLEHMGMKRLDLGENFIDGKMMLRVSQLLNQNSVITELALPENKLSGEGVKILSNIINNDKCFISNLDISGNSLNDLDCEHVANIMNGGRRLANLKVNHNQIHNKGGILLGEAIAKNTTLDKLDLSWNHLRGQGAEAIATGLIENDTLSLLDISWNGFGFEGCVAMGHALTHNSTLHHLNMESNRIHPPALFELSKGLISNRGLHTLKIGKNPLTAQCSTPFLCAIRDSPDITLTVLDIHGLIVDEKFEEVLMELVAVRPIQVYYDTSLPVHKNRLQEMRKARASRTLVFNIDPVQILFHLKSNLRNIDFFRIIDKDNSSKLSRNEIAKMLKFNGYPISSTGMDVIMEYLDTDGDGQIDFLEFSEGERRHKRSTLDKLEQLRDAMIGQGQVESSITDIRNNPAPGGYNSKYSSTFRPDIINGDQILK